MHVRSLQYNKGLRQSTNSHEQSDKYLKDQGKIKVLKDIFYKRLKGEKDPIWLGKSRKSL